MNKAQPKSKFSVFTEYAKAILGAALIAFFIRAFVIEAFRIPSGSMLPTLSIGDHIFVNKFIYGLRIPFTKTHYFPLSDPQRGDVIVFLYPRDESMDFIKRVVGLPGDRIHIDGSKIAINGVDVPQREVQVSADPDRAGRLLLQGAERLYIPAEEGWQHFRFYEEDLDGRKHLIQVAELDYRTTYDVVVPPDHLFVMGDNRDNSADSREWGFVPKGNVKGKALFVWLSLDWENWSIRWREFGRTVH